MGGVSGEAHRRAHEQGGAPARGGARIHEPLWGAFGTPVHRLGAVQAQGLPGAAACRQTRQRRVCATARVPGNILGLRKALTAAGTQIGPTQSVLLAMRQVAADGRGWLGAIPARAAMSPTPARARRRAPPPGRAVRRRPPLVRVSGWVLAAEWLQAPGGGVGRRAAQPI